ncbi:hypothetical protein [Streptomyces aurantiogriseus]|uniref:Uncharacterized protein n=1 Tax=Streptomyces aurantiogriseus TaxID=66870 RepID=A0A918L001_9ACTN|nr:hypothetical protein [Streptomyces aurantiogriseus]GGR61499.1 hypothetical protein GCM10010251_92940 [Streptomyces aurantiogriseus]
MATYTVTGRSGGGTSLIQIHIAGIYQDEEVVPELDVIASVKAYVVTLPGVVQAVAQKQELVTTNV